VVSPVFERLQPGATVLRASSEGDRFFTIGNRRARDGAGVNRHSFLRLHAASQQVIVAESNRTLARDTLLQARDRFAAGIADTIEVVQAQESVASAEEEYISSVYGHYVARLSLGRATGDATQGIGGLIRGTFRH
jgi:hypothetical protein